MMTFAAVILKNQKRMEMDFPALLRNPWHLPLEPAGP